jgi:hypothetical protein
VHGTVTLNDDPARLEEELKESISDEFDTARSQLEGLKDTVPAFNKDFEPIEQPTEEADKDGEQDKYSVGEEDGGDGRDSGEGDEGEGGEDNEDDKDGEEGKFLVAISSAGTN